MASKAIRPIRVEGNVAFIPLTRGYEAIIDAADVHLVEGRNWQAKLSFRRDGSIRAVYAKYPLPRGQGPRGEMLMHRVISGAPRGTDIDHRDGDGLNNRRVNLRTATRSQNQCNARVNSLSTSGLKGVSFHKDTGKWRAAIKIDGKGKHLGVFPTLEEAARAYSEASARIHGEFGRLQ